MEFVKLMRGSADMHRLSAKEENRSEPSDLACGPTVIGSREKCTREVLKPSGPSIGKDTWQELIISLTHRERRSKNILFELDV
jgi:hypothetical protein